MTAQIASMVASFQVHAVVMPVQVRLPLELLAARLAINRRRAGMGVFTIRVVRLHVRLPVVAPFEQLAADSTFVRSFLGRRSLSLLLDAVHARQYGCSVEAWSRFVSAHRVEVHRVGSGCRLGPIPRRAFVEILGGVR